MVLQSLTRYYDILADDPDSGIPLLGYSAANVSFALNLSPQGELIDVFPLFELVERGKKTVEVPRRMIIPQQVKRSSGVVPNFLCDNSAYVLGLTAKDASDLEYANKRFEAFCKLNMELLAQAKCSAARAVIAFLAAHDPQRAKENPSLAKYLDDILKGGNLVFKLDGSTGFIHEDPEIRRVWEAHKVGAANAYVSQCLVTGQSTPISRLHTSIRGIYGANSTGATLVGFNAPAYESYNRSGGQGLNSPISEKAAFAYTTALNYLLSSENKHKKITVGDATVVYWAESKDRVYETVFTSLFEPDQNEPQNGKAGDTPRRDAKAERLLEAIARKVMRTEQMDLKNLPDGLDINTRFYVLGLAPNAARISVRFFHQEPFIKIVQKIMGHYVDMQIVKEYDDQPSSISIRRILDETISKKSSEKNASPLMAGVVIQAILNDTPYPAALYYAIINRIRADIDDSSRRIKKINYVRAAVIKAFLKRKYRNQPQNSIQEVLIMSLNEQSTIPAYVLGRLFAVLEKAQHEAIGDVNASIKDRYFTSACASPASVFPVLLRLSQHYISKADKYHNDRRIEDILGLLDVEKNPIPARLSLDEQGIFVLGYYHQRAAFYVSKKDTEETKEK
jgi:CRISPR-associated protein Csd1